MCTRYMQLPECTSCGVSYEQISGDYFMVKAA